MLTLFGLNAFLLLGTGITSDDDMGTFFNGYVIFFDSLLVVAIVTVLHAVLTRKTNRSKEIVIALPMVFLLAYLLGIILREVFF